jgi:hypothetical protein
MNTPKGADVPKEPTVPERVRSVLDGPAITEGDEKQMRITQNMMKGLAVAFGGYEKVPQDVIGITFATQIHNGELSDLTIDDYVEIFDDMVRQICENLEAYYATPDVNQYPGPDQVRENIIWGIEKRAEGWQDEKLLRLVDVLGQRLWQ